MFLWARITNFIGLLDRFLLGFRIIYFLAWVGLFTQCCVLFWSCFAKSLSSGLLVKITFLFLGCLAFLHVMWLHCDMHTSSH